MLTIVGALVIGLVIGGVATYLVLNNTRHVSFDISKKLITNAEAFAMITRFGADGDESISGHFTTDELMGYLDFVNTAIEGQNIQTTGLEIFFAKYADGKNTFVIYPTYQNQDGHYIPFDPLTVSSVGPISLRALNHNQNGLLSTNSNNRSALNKSNMCPPRFETI